MKSFPEYIQEAKEDGTMPIFIAEGKKMTKDDAKAVADKIETKEVKPKAMSGNIVAGTSAKDMGIKLEDSALIADIIVSKKGDKYSVQEDYVLETDGDEFDDKILKKLGEDLGVKDFDQDGGEQTNSAKDLDEVASFIDFIVGKVEAAAKVLKKAGR